MHTIMPPPVRTQTSAETPADLDVTAIAHVIDNTHDPLLFAPALPGETEAERSARQAAAADILDDLLGEIAGWDQ